MYLMRGQNWVGVAGVEMAEHLATLRQKENRKHKNRETEVQAKI